jgi:hypothetical protein
LHFALLDGARDGNIDWSRAIVEVTQSFRRLRVRYDKRADIHEAFLSRGCTWICWQSRRKAGSQPEP